MRSEMRRLVGLLERAVVQANDSTSTRNRKVFNVVSCVAFGALFACAVGPLHAFNGATIAGWLYVGTGIALLLNVGAFVAWHRNNKLFVGLVLAIAGTGGLSACLAVGGMAATSGGFLWILVLLVALLTSNFPPQAQVFGSITLVAAVVAIAVFGNLAPTAQLPGAVQRALFAIAFLATSAYIFAVVFYMVGQSKRAFRLLRDERARSEQLLLNILPQEVAAALKERQGTVADHFPNASVLFADVVGFTPLTAAMRPPLLVEFLNEIFSCFDELVEQFGLEKIKTIGDCYMAASGVPRPREDHAVVLLQLALAMADTVRNREFAGRRLQFRIGVNSGPVVAGVIGKRKFAYDLWGDAVNTASRMESHGEPGQIQITRATYELVRDRFRCEARGTIEVKGKGRMEVWHVLGARAEWVASLDGPLERAEPTPM